MNQRREGKETAAWKKIVDIGAQLTPGHALFKGTAAGVVDDLSMDDLASHTPESMDIDLSEDDQQEALLPDLDLENDEAEAAAKATATAEETVEFDLSETGAETIVEEEGVEFDLSEAGAATEAGVGAEAVEDAVEFDLSEAISESPVEAEEDAVEFDLDETQALEPEQADEEEFSLDIEADELGFEEEAETAEHVADADNDLDLSAEAESLNVADDAGEEEFSLDDVDASSLGLDIADDDAEESTVLETAEADKAGQSTDDIAEIMDLENMDLDEAIVEAVAQPETDDELDLSDLDDVDEVGTKLDLAKAYLDMGDADGTRSILDEVMSEGDDTQKREAEELLRQIG
jgi:pilus assembly protein FimV